MYLLEITRRGIIYFGYLIYFSIISYELYVFRFRINARENPRSSYDAHLFTSTTWLRARRKTMNDKMKAYTVFLVLA